jgi:hypothetical protein
LLTPALTMLTHNDTKLKVKTLFLCPNIYRDEIIAKTMLL